MIFSLILVSLCFSFCKNDQMPHDAVRPDQNEVQSKSDRVAEEQTVMNQSVENQQERAKLQEAVSDPRPSNRNDQQPAPEAIPEAPAGDVNQRASQDKERPAGEAEVVYGGKLEQVGTEHEAGDMHDAFDQLLIKYVTVDGRVDYASLKAKSGELESYLDLLSSQDPSSMERSEALAFWINSYNAFTIKLILDHYPLESITEIDGGQPWSTEWVRINGRVLSLDQIENEIIRPQFEESRIHFAVNCAAKSCPPLLNRAWTADKLEQQLEQQTKKFINNNKYNSISKDRVAVSRIFEWYAQDFGDLIEYINRYSNVQVDADAKITYLEYDWSLNE